MDENLRNEQFRQAAFGALSVKYPTIDEVRATVGALQKAFCISDVVAAKCIKDIEAQQGVSMTIGAVLASPEFEPWLEAAKATIEPYYWDRYRRMLTTTGRIPARVVGTMDQVTDEILGRCEDPNRSGPWDRRGMVVGHVQSGKTGNYTGLICKAADAGYRLIVVIAGVHNKLRNQTQERIDEGFIGLDSAKLFSADHGEKFVGVGRLDKQRIPTTYTNSLKDFSKSTATSVGQSIKNNNEPMVFVIKKNSSTLKNLAEWLRQHNTIREGEKIDQPMILIDDEADNASINIAYGRGEVSKINGQIRDILALFERSSYVGYTATPFANIFVDPATDHEMLGADLFPKDFIVSLDPPTNYLGPNRMFLERPDAFLETIDDAELFLPLSHKIDFGVTELPPSLTDAVDTFIVGRAIRLNRGQAGSHMSMLVNASRFTRVQDELRDAIFRYVDRLSSAVRVDAGKPHPAALKNPDLKRLHDAWESHYSSTGTSWKTVQEQLVTAVTAIKVVSINSRSSGSLNYNDYRSDGLTVIAVGGFALSRGLTLEGLMISYFYRRSLMYDTLMQMGRWFGYREGYEDLCRVWMTEEAQGWFEHISESVDLLRDEVKAMQAAGAAPKEFGLKVRSHPASLLITARNKIGFAREVTVQIGLGNSMIETTTLLGTPEAITHNWHAVETMTKRLSTKEPINVRAKKSQYGWLVENVACEDVLDFLRSFKNHQRSLLTQTDAVGAYIQAGEKTTLASWDVLYASLRKPSADNAAVPILGLPVVPQKRAVGSKSNSTMICVSEKQRVASRGVEKSGVPAVLAAAAEQDWDEDPERKKDKQKVSNYPDKIYRKVRPKPLLIIHSLRLTWANAPTLDPRLEPIVAWGISFPHPIGPEPRVTFLVNTQWFKENLGSEEDEEDEEDLDDEG